MSRRGRIILYSIAAVGLVIVLAFGVLIYGRLTGKINFARVPTGGCEPAIPRGSYLLASAWIEPKPFDLVCFMQPDARFARELWVQRLCGMPGDTILIEDGRLFVNGSDADVFLELKHSYSMRRHHAQELIDRGQAREEDLFPLSGDSAALIVEDRLARLEPGMERIIISAAEEAIAEHYLKPWSRDRFGPLVVPEGHWFMLGDNRHASFDSRAIGCVPIGEFRGTVWKIF